jgi:hypothetical protein
MTLNEHLKHLQWLMEPPGVRGVRSRAIAGTVLRK